MENQIASKRNRGRSELRIKYGILSIVFLILIGCSSTSSVTNDIYLIPKGYEGNVYVFYNVKDAPSLTKEGDYDVYVINDMGYFVTSSPEMDYGRVTDKYYYVDKNGQRSPIQNDCVRGMGTGGLEKDIGTSNKIEIKYTGIEVTNNRCGQSFMDGGNGMYPEDIDTVLKEILKVQYGLDQ